MPVIRKSALVPYSAQAMFDLVERVEDYPGFLPWCGGTQLLSRTEEGMSAAITIDFRGIRQTFSTENVHQRPTSIRLRLKDGPFYAPSFCCFVSAGSASSKKCATQIGRASCRERV